MRNQPCGPSLQLLMVIGCVLTVLGCHGVQGVQPPPVPSGHWRRGASHRLRYNEALQRQEKQLVKSRRHRGTVVSFFGSRPPTTQQVSAWFHNEDGLFNHDTAGMTNPSLQVSVNDQVVLQVRQVQNKKKNQQQQEESEVVWWPKLANIQHSQRGKWRVRCYRSRVGQGRECYERCRDASLAWEFQSSPSVETRQGRRRRRSQPSDRGIVAVHPLQQQQQKAAERLVHRTQLQQVAHPCGFHTVQNTPADDGVACLMVADTTQNAHCIRTGQGRRLATYTRLFSTSNNKNKNWLSFVLPPIYVVNPVRMVYELVDARAVDGSTTYTSSAYATTRGHWLRGEERTTVALRDDGQHVDVEILSYSRPADTLWGKLVWPLVGPLQSAFFHDQLHALQRIAQPPPSITVPPPPPIQQVQMTQ